jgi:hypothetical protein
MDRGTSCEKIDPMSTNGLDGVSSEPCYYLEDLDRGVLHLMWRSLHVTEKQWSITMFFECCVTYMLEVLPMQAWRQ